MTIQKERWLVCYNFKTHDGEGEITHVILNHQDTDKPWEGEQMKELVAIAREDVLMKLGIDEDVGGEVLGEFVLTGVTPMGLLKDISIAFDEEDEGGFDELLDELERSSLRFGDDDELPVMPGVRVNIPAPLPADDSWISGLKEAVGTFGAAATRSLGGVMRLTDPTKKETLQ